MNRNTAQRYFSFFKGLVIKDARKDRDVYLIENGVEVNESYFGPRRVRGRRGRGASKKIIVSGIIETTWEHVHASYFSSNTSGNSADHSPDSKIRQ